MVGPEEDWYEGQPHNAGGVHGEPDVLGFVEVFRYFSGFYRIKCADSDEDHAVNLELILIIRRKTLYNLSSECNVFDESCYNKQINIGFLGYTNILPFSLIKKIEKCEIAGFQM